jgi:hypothetical protein
MRLNIKAKGSTIKIYNPPEDIRNIALIYATENLNGKICVYVISPVEQEKIFLFTKNNEDDAKGAIELYWKKSRELKMEEKVF